jgi:intracellular multiplication protein IcmG
MNNHTNAPQDDELEGFDAFEEEALAEDAALADEPIDDADFQDISDDVDADVFGESEPTPAPKKKTSWFNIGIATIAIAVAGGLVFMKLGPTLMGGGDTAVNAPVAGGPDSAIPSPGAPAPASDAQAAAQAALAPENQPDAAAKMPGLLDAPEQFANLSAMQGGAVPAPAAPVPSSNDPFAGVPTQIPSGAPAPVAAMPAPDQAQVPMPAPIAPGPVATSSMPSPDTAMPAPAVNIQPETLPAPAPAAAVAMPSADTSVLETKVSSLENRLNEMDNKLSAIAQAPAANDSRLNSIQTTLERLESRLDDVVTRKAPAVREVSAPSDGPSEVSPAPVKRTTARKAAAPKKAKKEQWDEAYSPSRSTPVAVSSPASSGSGGWELRGATPGRATLARGNDIREIGVGESVPGLGEITGVAQMNGKWVVQGTQGRLAQ